MHFPVSCRSHCRACRESRLGGLGFFDSFSRPASRPSSSTRSTGSAPRHSPRYLRDDATFELHIDPPSRGLSREASGFSLASPLDFFRSMSHTFSRAASGVPFFGGGSSSPERFIPPAPPNTNMPGHQRGASAPAVEVAGRLGLFENMSYVVPSPTSPGEQLSSPNRCNPDQVPKPPPEQSGGLFRRLSSTFRSDALSGLSSQSPGHIVPSAGCSQCDLLPDDNRAEETAKIELYCQKNMGIKPEDLKPTAMDRIKDLSALFRSLEDKGIVRLEPASPGSVNSIFGFQRIFVVDCTEFNREVKEMVQADRNRCWHANGKRNLVQPTLPCYELLRQLGVHPVKGTRGRDAAAGKRDFLVYSQYTFTLARMKHNCSRLKIGVIGNRRI